MGYEVVEVKSDLYMTMRHELAVCWAISLEFMKCSVVHELSGHICTSALQPATCPAVQDAPGQATSSSGATEVALGRAGGRSAWRQDAEEVGALLR